MMIQFVGGAYQHKPFMETTFPLINTERLVDRSQLNYLPDIFSHAIHVKTEQ